jgi:hypothetical protein
MTRIDVKSRRWRGSDTKARKSRQLRPTVIALEDRELLSTLTVSNFHDSGPGSLRAAVNQADTDGGGDTIVFSSIFSGGGVIRLISGELLLDTPETTTITGPGASLLSISGNGQSRVFKVSGRANLAGMTIIQGNTGHDSNDNFGGGILNSGDLTLTDMTVQDNYALFGGGVLNTSTGLLTMTSCTISGNRAQAGGGLYIGYAYHRDDGGGKVTLTNCTISGNSVQGSSISSDGGGLFNADGAEATLMNCTVTGNTAQSNGDGLCNDGNALLTNTIVSGNGGNDIANPCLGIRNLIGDGSGFRHGTDNLLGTSFHPIDPLLGPLGDYGGPTPTFPLLPGSLAIGGGTASNAPANDQRGQPRVGLVDIGAFQSQGFTLTPAAGSTPQLTAAGSRFANPLAVMVTANNSVEPVDGGIVSFAVAPVDGASATLSSATATIAGGQASVSAVANATTGRYDVVATATGAGPATFALKNAVALSLVVTTQHDVVDDIDDLTSLREAISYANSHPGPDTITFDPSISGKARRTIVLTGGPLVLTDPATTTIIGPGARLLAISGGGRSRVFDIEGGSLALSGLTIARGRARNGGGIRNERGRLSLTDVFIRDNRANMGGGLYNDGRTTFSGVSIESNHARIGPELFNTRAATLFWRRWPVKRRAAISEANNSSVTSQHSRVF